MTDPAVADPETPDRSTRRALLGAGVLGAVIAAAAGRAASAATGEDSDTPLAAFAIALELTARDLYAAAVAAGHDDEGWTVMRSQHAAYAERIAGITGIPAGARADDVYDALVGAFEDDPATAGLELENTAAATHVELIAEVANVDLAGAMASIASMESRHATVLAVLSGQGDDLDALLVNTATPLSPEA